MATSYKQGNQRMFGNKVYFLFDLAFTKREAIKEAEKLRNGKDKWFVRVVKAGDGYQIWRR